jgi:hypothetical protein
MLYVVYYEDGIACAMFVIEGEAKRFIKSQPKVYNYYYKGADAWEHWMSIRDKAVDATVQLA